MLTLLPDQPADALAGTLSAGVIPAPVMTYQPMRRGAVVKDPPGYNRPATIAARVDVLKQLLAQAEPESAEHTRLLTNIASLERTLHAMYAHAEAAVIAQGGLK